MKQEQPKPWADEELEQLDTLAAERGLSREATIVRLARMGLACMQGPRTRRSGGQPEDWNGEELEQLDTLAAERGLSREATIVELARIGLLAVQEFEGGRT